MSETEEVDLEKALNSSARDTVVRVVCEKCGYHVPAAKLARHKEYCGPFFLKQDKAEKLIQKHGVLLFLQRVLGVPLMTCGMLQARCERLVAEFFESEGIVPPVPHTPRLPSGIEGAMLVAAKQGRVRTEDNEMKHWSQEVAMSDVVWQWLLTHTNHLHGSKSRASILSETYNGIADAPAQNMENGSVSSDMPSTELSQDSIKGVAGHDEFLCKSAMCPDSRLSPVNIAQMSDIPANMDTEICIIELGAGGGEWIHMFQCVAHTTMVLVDYYPAPRMVDSIYETNPNFVRIWKHIEDLQADDLRPHLRAINIIFAKHLCGDGFDSALHKIREWGQEMPIHLLAMAPCCQHRSEWTTYTGRTWWESRGYTEADFKLVTQKMNWKDAKNRAHDKTKVLYCIGSLFEAMHAYGRKVWLESQGWHADMLYFIDEGATMRNLMFLAWPTGA